MVYFLPLTRVLSLPYFPLNQFTRLYLDSHHFPDWVSFLG